MPASDTALILLCVGLSLLGLLYTGISVRRGARGRVVQGVGLTLAPVALYLAGLLGLVWNGALTVIRWAGDVVFSPAVWLGLSLLALCVVLYIVGGMLVSRAASRSSRSKVADTSSAPAVGASAAAGRTSAPAKNTGRTASASKDAKPADDDMADIEALLKKRGIE